MATAHLIFATSTALGDTTLQSVIAMMLGGGMFASIAAFRKAKPEAELSTLQGMQILMERLEQDNKRLRGEHDEVYAEREAAEAHALYLERTLLRVEGRLRRWEPQYNRQPEPPPVPPAP